MEKLGHIEISIKSSNKNIELTPDNYDIRDIISIFEDVENLLFPNNKKDRPTISYGIESGSVKHIFKMPNQYVIGFNEIIGKVEKNKNIDFLEPFTANTIEKFQNMALKKEYLYNIKTSVDNSNEIIIDKSTKYSRKKDFWANAEYYFYGQITNAGGKDNANIHINTSNLGTLIIQTPIEVLESFKENILYKTYGIRTKCKQKVSTGEIDKKSLEFLELVKYNPVFDEASLEELREKARKTWLGKIDAEKLLKELRGYDD